MNLLFFIKKRKTIAIAFSDYKGCPCYISYNEIKQKKITETILYKSFSEIDFSNVLKFKNVIVFAHGNPYTLKCFLKKDTVNGLQDIYINNDYWDELFNVKGNFYFHVCYGSRIINQINSNKNNLKNWVSYENEINWFYHDDEVINEIYTDFNIKLCKLIGETKSSFAFFNSLKSSYHNLISQITDRNTGKPIEGYEYMVTLMLRNIESLKYSA